MSILDELELSVRAHNVLKSMGTVETLDDFMALTRETVTAQKAAGARTWREICEIQETFAPDPAAIYRHRWAEFQDAVGVVNKLMDQEPRFRVCDAGQGFLVAVQSGPREAFGRSLFAEGYEYD